MDNNSIESVPVSSPLSSPRWFAYLGITAVLVIVVLFALVRLQGVLLVVAASMVIALGVQPFIGYLTRLGLSRASAMGVLLAGGVGLGGAVLAMGVPLVSTQLAAITERGPDIIDDMRRRSDLIDAVLSNVDMTSMLADGETIGGFVSGMLNLITVAILAPYLAFSLPQMKIRVLRLLHREDRRDFIRILDEATDRLSGFIAGNLVVSVAAAVSSYIALKLIGAPYPAALALWIGITDLVPLVGVFLGAVPAVAITLVESGQSEAVAVAVFILMYQQLENYLIAPRVMRRTVNLSPPVVIISLMVGGSLAGVLGALLALPVAALVQLLLDEFVIGVRIRKVAHEPAPEQHPYRLAAGRPKHT